MKRTLIGLAVLATLGGGVTAATADPGPNGKNDFGLCKAYFAGSEQGQEKKRQAPPFVALEEAAEASDQTVEEFCATAFPGGKDSAPGGGQGGGKGRPA